MGETTDRLEAHIEQTREDLGSNLQELEHKVKAATDWREHFRSKPGMMMGLAFGSGLLLAAVTNNGGRRNVRRAHSENGRRGGGEVWDYLKTALIGLAVSRVKDYVGHLIPSPGRESHRDVRTETAD